MAHPIYGEREGLGQQRTALLRSSEHEFAGFRTRGRRHQQLAATIERNLAGLRSFPLSILELLSFRRRARRVELERQMLDAAHAADEAEKLALGCRRRIESLRRDIVEASPRVIGAQDARPLKLQPGVLQGLRENLRFFGRDLTRAYQVDLQADCLRHSVGVDPLLTSFLARVDRLHGELARLHADLDGELAGVAPGAGLDAIAGAAADFLRRRRAYVETWRSFEGCLTAFLTDDLLVWNEPQDSAAASIVLRENLIADLAAHLRGNGLDLWSVSTDLPAEYFRPDFLAVRPVSHTRISERFLGCLMTYDLVDFSLYARRGLARGAFHDPARTAICIEREAYAPGGEALQSLLAAQPGLVAEYGHLPLEELSDAIRRSELVRASVHALFARHAGARDSLRQAVARELCARLAAPILSPLARYEFVQMDALRQGDAIQVAAYHWLIARARARFGEVDSFAALAGRDYQTLVSAAKVLLAEALQSGLPPHTNETLLALARLTA